MRRSEARPSASAPRSAVLSGTTGAPPGRVPDGSSVGGSSPAGELGLVGAYWRGGDIRARFRDAKGRLVESRHPVEHSFFLRREDLTRELSGAGTVAAALDRARGVLWRRPEGDWERVAVRDRDVLEAICAPGKWAEGAGLTTYEGDLHPVKRWMLDSYVRIGRPRRCYLDLEAYLPDGMGNFRTGLVLVWSLSVDARDLTAEERDRLDVGEGVVDVEVGRGVLEGVDEREGRRSERTLIEGLLAALGDYDQVLAWNGDRFDFEFLEQRADALGIDVDWRRWLRLDHMVLVKRMNVSASKSGEEKRSFALAAWKSHVLGESKVVDLATGTHVSWKMWLAGGAERERLGAYCADDAGSMVRIEAKTGFVELHQTICEAAGVLPDSRTIGPKQPVESFVMRLGRARGMRFPSFFGYEGGAEQDENGKLFEGAFVLKPTKLGIIENVHVCDFSRLYPSIAQTFNLSPETLFKRKSEIKPSDVRPTGVCEVPGSGHWFKTEPRGLLPFVFDEMLRLRAIWDDKKVALPPGSPEWNEADKRSTAYKNMTNAAFGVTGSRWSRFFVVECAESMTLGGAHLIQRVIAEGERRGIETMAGDTDSAFCERVTKTEFAAFIAYLNKDVFPALVRELGGNECRIKLAYEKAFDRIVFTSAKHYGGRISHFKGSLPNEDSQPEIKGLEFKRGDCSRLAAAMQAEALDLLLGGGVLPGSKRRPTCESRPEVFVRLVEDWRSRVINKDLPIRDIVISKRLSKEPEAYKRPLKKDGTLGSPPPQVRAAVMARARGQDIGAGVRVEYLVADAREKTLLLAEDYDGSNVDRAHLWENLVYPATLRVLEACFPSVKWAAYRTVRKHLGDKRQVRLFEY